MVEYLVIKVCVYPLFPLPVVMHRRRRYQISKGDFNFPDIIQLLLYLLNDQVTLLPGSGNTDGIMGAESLDTFLFTCDIFRRDSA